MNFFAAFLLLCSITHTKITTVFNAADSHWILKIFNHNSKRTSAHIPLAIRPKTARPPVNIVNQCIINIVYKIPPISTPNTMHPSTLLASRVPPIKLAIPLAITANNRGEGPNINEIRASLPGVSSAPKVSQSHQNPAQIKPKNSNNRLNMPSETHNRANFCSNSGLTKVYCFLAAVFDRKSNSPLSGKNTNAIKTKLKLYSTSEETVSSIRQT